LSFQFFSKYALFFSPSPINCDNQACVNNADKWYWVGSQNMKTPLAGVNFTNVLRTAFMLVDPKKHKKQLSHQYLLYALGSASIKAVLRTLMKLSPAEDIDGFVTVLSINNRVPWPRIVYANKGRWDDGGSASQFQVICEFDTSLSPDSKFVLCSKKNPIPKFSWNPVE